MPLVIPRALAEERERINADRRAQVFSAYCEQWTKEVQKVDRYLEVVRASDYPTDPDLVPGGWYLLKHIPGSVDELIQLPKPPGPWLYDWLLARDMWNPSVYRNKKAAAEKYRAAKTRAQNLEKEQRQDEMALALRAANRLRDDKGMHSNSQAKREGKGMKKGKS